VAWLGWWPRSRPAGSCWPVAGVHVRPTTSYVRELGARTQPGSGFFRATDTVAGGLIVVLAAGLRSGLARDWRRGTSTAGLGLAGVASVVDGWKPMDWAPSAACSGPSPGAGASASSAWSPAFVTAGLSWPSYC